jgi:hypothetical protein
MIPGWAKPEKMAEFVHQINARREFHILQGKWFLKSKYIPTYGETNAMIKESEDFMKKSYRDKRKFRIILYFSCQRP